MGHISHLQRVIRITLLWQSILIHYSFMVKYNVALYWPYFYFYFFEEAKIKYITR